MVGATFSVAAAAEVLRSKKAITAVGNAQVDTAQSYFGGASALFDGADDYLVANTSEALTGDFTMECWFRAANISAGYRAIVVLGNEATGRFVLYMNGSQIGCNLYGVGTYDIVSNSAIAATTWYHITVVKNGSTQTLYLNGVSKGSVTAASSYGNTGGYYIGNLSTLSDDFNGHIDEVRISNSARYTTTFTPSTTPFVNDANTLLLIHADGTDASTFFEDDNGVRAPKGITAVGNAQVDTAQSKFGGSSALFDGTGDYLIINNLTSSSTFTFECWVRFASLPTSGSYTMLLAHTANQYVALTNQGGSYFWEPAVIIAGQAIYVARFPATVSTNTWYHIAIQKTGTTITCYQNGTSISSSQSFNTLTEPMFLFDTTTRIGAFTNNTYVLNGHIDELRLSNSVRYTSNFTPSTTPFVNDANTLLLIHADGTDGSTVFRDDNGARNQVGLQANGNAAISTTQSKFGGTSAAFDNTGDYITSVYNSAFNFTSGNFTVECWCYPTEDSSELITNYEYNTNNGWSLGLRSNGRVLWVSSNGSTGLSVYGLSPNNQYTLNAWNHIAITRSGTTIKCYVNGTEQWTSSSFANIDSSTAGLSIGRGYGVSSGLFLDGPQDFGGYLDEIRISNSVRYTANFTAPTAPFQNDANTVLLMHCDGTNASTVFFDDNGIAPYTP